MSAFRRTATGPARLVSPVAAIVLVALCSLLLQSNMAAATPAIGDSRDKGHDSSLPALGYDRSNPAGLGISLSIAVDSTGSTNSYSSNDFSVRLTTIEVVRGDQAWQRILAANMFNSPPKTGYEYILAKVRFEYLDGPTADTTFDVSSVCFDAISTGGVQYEQVFVVEPDPSIDVSLYPGAFHEGWLAVQAATDDSTPLLTFGRTYDGTGGIWFTLSPGSIVLPSPTPTSVPPPSPPPAFGYGRSNPAGLGISLSIAVDSTGSTSSYSSNDFSVRLTTIEVVRGDQAWQRILAANMFNSPPKTGYEYILAKVRFEYLNGPTADTTFDVSSVWFDAISTGGVQYEQVFVVEPDPSIDVSLYPGAFHEGWLAVQVATDDSTPLLTFGRTYDGTGGIWFTLYTGAPTVTSLAPSTGAQGATLTAVAINGTHLTGATAVGFAGTGVTASGIVVVNDSQITANVAIDGNATVGARNVTATTPGGTSAPLVGGFTVIPPPLVITTSALPRWPAERGVNLPAIPGWAKGVPYTASLTAVGGTLPYSWSATSLPAGVNISTDGNVTGVPTAAGVYNIVFTVTDSSTPPATVSKTLALQIYVKGGATGGSSVTGADMAYLLQVFLGHHPPNAGADANLDGVINGADVVGEEWILLGRP